jgi:hypothetical protein
MPSLDTRKAPFLPLMVMIVFPWVGVVHPSRTQVGAGKLINPRRKTVG